MSEIVDGINNLDINSNDKLLHVGNPLLDYTVPFPDTVSSYGHYKVPTKNGPVLDFQYIDVDITHVDFQLEGSRKLKDNIEVLGRPEGFNLKVEVDKGFSIVPTLCRKKKTQDYAPGVIDQANGVME